MRVYLCGTITADPATHSWRAIATEQLTLSGHVALNPLRKKDLTQIAPDGLSMLVGAEPVLFVERDERDIRSADVLLMNTLGIEKLERQSIGTWAEMGLARGHRIPIVVIADHPSVLGHPFVIKWAAAVVPTLREALQIADWLADGPEMW